MRLRSGLYKMQYMKRLIVCLYFLISFEVASSELEFSHRCDISFPLYKIVSQVARHLILAGHDVHLVSAAPDFVYTTEIQSPHLHIRKVNFFLFGFPVEETFFATFTFALSCIPVAN